MSITTPPTAAEALADALARLDDPRTALHHDAQSDAIRALALTHVECGADLTSLWVAVRGLTLQVNQLIEVVAELHEHWEQEI